MVLAAVIACTTLLGCSGAVEAGGSGPSSLDRPKLTVVAQAPVARAPRVIGDFDLGVDQTGWEIDAVRTEIVQAKREGADPEPLLRVFGKEKKMLTFALPEAMRGFTSFECRVRIDRTDTLELVCFSGDVERGRLHENLRASPDVQTVIIQQLPAFRDRIDRIGVAVCGVGPVEIGRMLLIDEPYSARLPAPDGEPQMIAIGEDNRRGVGLSMARPLETRLAVQDDSLLCFSYGRPELVRAPGEFPVIAVTLTGARGERVHRLPFEGEREQPRWHFVRLPLDDLGDDVHARFELEGAEATACAITDLTLRRPEPRPPSVLLITSDTHRADHIGTAGMMQIATPALDALAARGVFFENCFSSTNVTLPSHVAILTGTHPRDTRVIDNESRLGEAAPTIAERFQAAGYATLAATSANHLDVRWSGLGQGFDRMAICNQNQRDSAATIAFLDAWLAEFEEAPLFVWLHVFDAHTPYTPPKPFDRRYYPSSLDPFSPTLPELTLDPRLVPRQLKGLRDLEYVRAQYKGEVSYLDGELTRVLQNPRFLRGVTAVTADHGESLGEHQVYWDHAQLYPESIHVPLLIAWPQAPVGTRVSARIDQLDLCRTLLDLSKLSSTPFPGKSLLRMVEGARPAEEPLHAIAAYGFSASITRGKWHLILHLKRHGVDQYNIGPVKERHAVELYDLEADPKTQNNLAEQQADVAAGLRAELIHWLGDGSQSPWNERNEADTVKLGHLAAMGYTGGAEMAQDAPWFPSDCECTFCALYP